jgi:peroxiredoxin
MNKRINEIKMKGIIFSFFACCFSVSLFAQEITEENYLKLNSVLWKQYELDMETVSKNFKEFPEKKDSLMKVANSIYETASRGTRELAMKYATVPSGLQRLFMVRLDIPKDTLRSIYENLPNKMKISQYGKNILFHLDSEQIKENDKYYDFEATTCEGTTFKLSSFAGKNILLLYGGLGCMGQGGRDYLNSLYGKTSREDFEIVVYETVLDLNNLKNVRTMYRCDFLLASDFLRDSSPVKILYGAQETPTCIFIDREGVVRMKTIGLYENRVDELVAKNK